MSTARIRARFVAIPAAAVLDVLAHRLSDRAGQTAVRYGAAIALLGIAHAAGISWADLGLDRKHLGSGVRTGVLAGACAAAAIFAGAAMPATRGIFLDDRAAQAASRADLAGGLARITLAAVPPEELTYRSALYGLLLGNGTRAGAVTWPSVLFGVSHVLPTLSTMSQTAVGHHLVHRPLRQAAFVAGNVTVTSAAGAVFAWLRLRSGSVLAPLLTHAALNDSALVAGRVAHKLGRRQPAGVRWRNRAG